MFIGIKNPQVNLEVRRLPKRERQACVFPILVCASQIGEEFSFEACLFPETCNTMIIKVAAVDALRTFKALELKDVHGLHSLQAAVDALGQATVSFGHDPSEAVAAAFNVPSDEGMIQSRIRSAAWWLRFGLADKALREYRASFARLQQLLRFMPNISFPSDEEVKHEEFLPEGVYGQTMLAFLRYHLADLEQELKSALNNDALALKLDVLAPDENINDCYAESGKLWQKFHGIMWGPFES